MIGKLSINSSSLVCLLEENLEQHIPSIRNVSRLRFNTFYVLQALLLFTNIFIFAICIVRLDSTTRMCEEYLSSYSPAIEALGTTQTRHLEGTFDLKSVYKGTPNEELDAAWNNITYINIIGLSEDEVRRVGQDPKSSVKLRPENREGSKIYAGMLEVFHHLHCLNLLRMMIYFDYYKDNEGIRDVRDENLPHVDHCIDILRQVLMCYTDVSLLTYKWVTFLDHPTPDFNTKHVCRDFRALQQWSMENGVNFAPIQKSKGIIEFDHYP